MMEFANLSSSSGPPASSRHLMSRPEAGGPKEHDGPVLKVAGLTKSFIVHAHGDLALPVLRDVALAVSPGECLALVGPSGAGKSTLLRSLYGNYRANAGSIRVHHDNAWTELVDAEPRTVLDVRRRTMGFVSQFLRVIPRVATVDVVAEPLLRLGADPAEARDRAEFLLTLLNIPQRLWQLPPATFSGGEQQRVNIARSLIVDYPILLLDEPTASLDAGNRDRVVELLEQRRDAGSALVGIFHDIGVRELLGNRVFEVSP
jgi:alpha-D-ribose 1-methylphosphonate 5-triphosphate synthase subunit PhnL